MGSSIRFLTEHLSMCFILKPWAVLKTPWPQGLGLVCWHVPLSCMYPLFPSEIFPWGGPWGNVTFAQISGSASHPILATNPMTWCISCALLEGHKQQCHSVLVAAGMPPAHVGHIQLSRGTSQAHAPHQRQDAVVKQPERLLGSLPEHISV